MHRTLLVGPQIDRQGDPIALINSLLMVVGAFALETISLPFKPGFAGVNM
jgi:hypothetical protein